MCRHRDSETAPPGRAETLAVAFYFVTLAVAFYFLTLAVAFYFLTVAAPAMLSGVSYRTCGTCAVILVQCRAPRRAEERKATAFYFETVGTPPTVADWPVTEGQQCTQQVRDRDCRAECCFLW